MKLARDAHGLDLGSVGRAAYPHGVIRRQSVLDLEDEEIAIPMLKRLTEAEYRHAIFPDRPFGPIPDVADDVQWDTIHLLFGQATLRAQAYEDALARFVIAAEGVWPRSGKSTEAILRLPLDPLQKEYARYCLLEPWHIDELARALRVRNSLAHSFYRRRQPLLEDHEGRKHVISELHEASDLFQRQRDEVYWNLSILTGIEPV